MYLLLSIVFKPTPERLNSLKSYAFAVVKEGYPLRKIGGLVSSLCTQKAVCFDLLKEWDSGDCASHRLCGLNIHGVPPIAWCSEFFGHVAVRFGQIHQISFDVEIDDKLFNVFANEALSRSPIVTEGGKISNNGSTSSSNEGFGHDIKNTENVGFPKSVRAIAPEVEISRDISREVSVSSGEKGMVGTTCDSQGLANKWDIYWHRSIQNVLNKWACLGCKDKYSAHCEDGSEIVVQSCCLGVPSQRWEITGDGGIKNTETGLYLTVDNSGPGLIAASRVHGGALNQSWVFKKLDG
ncbi:hypothetical protein Tsubulata_033120 [Turnera subulata]|uniref:Ricin B lectin domain-containing protein n=1 Tax=Turnera subulata TaxID=218843 RepID=A0A9Q0FDI4_9ROSI|nr:hypothetical protein Tsubulata_033120 [Turnera subulata]